ncbi:MAG: polysaccharide pyruvyl transferase family protein [Phycisphaerales bacterium]|nr:MAG: polysaccharide pyruvyl transferase family protein [Phycisphaerales bacterium]
MGVSALAVSAIESIAQRIPDATLYVLDYGRGVSSITQVVSTPPSFGVKRAGAYRTRRAWRSESWFRLNVETMCPVVISTTAQVLRRATAMLDVSGGDSFTTLYGMERYRSIADPKRYALRRGRPLILLPQTYGPFTKEVEADAANIVRQASGCWARDERSFAVLRALLGDSFDPAKHRCGVDMAFGLRARDGTQKLPPSLRSTLEAGADAGPLVGFNVSGLIYNDPEGARARYGFRADYAAAVEAFLEAVLGTGAARVLLVPHVVTPAGHYESDPEACDRVAATLRDRHADRVFVAPPTLDQSEMKWLIARCDWFCGTRMHSTIAGLSSGVPTATIAYSDKAQGVFESCGQGAHVVDPRRCETQDVVDHLLRSFNGRDVARASLAAHVPGVLGMAEQQMDDIAAMVRESTSSDAGSRPA